MLVGAYIESLKRSNDTLKELIAATKPSSTRVQLEGCFETLDTLRINLELNFRNCQSDIA